GAFERPQAAPSEPAAPSQRPLSAPLGERLPEPSIGRENRPPAAGAVGDSLLVPTPTPTPVATPRPAPRAVAAPAQAAPTTQQAAPAGGSWNVSQVSWYGPGFYGQRTAFGTTLGTGTVGVAHRSLPCGTQVQFRNAGRIVTAPVIDRGPYSGGRAFDLSGALCSALAHCYTGAIEWRLP
ncbi:MAG: septal ring lytic transglycosylase RlpA family protein, partial [Candidatus Limnocylindrales bacterium]